MSSPFYTGKMISSLRARLRWSLLYLNQMQLHFALSKSFQMYCPCSLRVAHVLALLPNMDCMFSTLHISLEQAAAMVEHFHHALMPIHKDLSF